MTALPQSVYPEKLPSDLLQVQMLMERSTLPSYVINTALLTEATLNDVLTSSELIVRLAYSAAFCRCELLVIFTAIANRQVL
jgi:hypothetical protein